MFVVSKFIDNNCKNTKLPIKLFVDNIGGSLHVLSGK